MPTAVRLKISPPWVTYVNKLNALFCEDPNIKIVYDNDKVTVRSYVNSGEKAEALYRLLPMDKVFGEVVLQIYVIPSNEEDFKSLDIKNPPKEVVPFAMEGYLEGNSILHNASTLTLFNAAFEGNPVYAFGYPVEGILSNTITYIVFKNCVVQFFNDNLNDLYGNISTLYQDIAADIFANNHDIQGVFYCTDVEHKVGKPLGEWP